MDVVEAI